MRGYDSVDMLEYKNSWLNQTKKEIWNFVDSLISSFVKTQSFEVVIPKNVYLRTKLLCEYISEKIDVNFGVSNFIMTLYLEFLQTSIEKYNPNRIYQEMNRSHGYNEVLLIHANDTVYKFPKKNTNKTILSINIDKKDAEKGQLLLDEIEELYGQAPSLDELLSTLWVNFIEDYKAGNNQKALNEIIRILKRNKEFLD